MNANSVVDTLKTHIGDDGFKAVVAVFGGQDLSIPVKITGSAFEAIVNGVGHDVAASLVNIFAGDIIYIPNCKRIAAVRLKDDVIAMHQQGVQIEAIAKQKNITHRWVRAIIAMNKNRNKK
jgi:Mor family transcriptional regulator